MESTKKTVLGYKIGYGELKNGAKACYRRLFNLAEKGDKVNSSFIMPLIVSHDAGGQGAKKSITLTDLQECFCEFNKSWDDYHKSEDDGKEWIWLLTKGEQVEGVDLDSGFAFSSLVQVKRIDRAEFEAGYCFLDDAPKTRLKRESSAKRAPVKAKAEKVEGKAQTKEAKALQAQDDEILPIVSKIEALAKDFFKADAEHFRKFGDKVTDILFEALLK